MTPILVRPVREQLEHDRVIRLLQQRWRRKYAVGINQGSETTAVVGQPDAPIYPDVVLAPLGRPAKPEILVEVETGESVNNLEAMFEWVRMAQLKAAFHLYVPSGSVDAARRLCADHKIPVAEIWTYHPMGDQMRFTQVYKAPESRRASRRAAEAAAAPKKAARPAPSARAKKEKPAARKAPAAKRPAAAKKPAGSRKPAAAKQGAGKTATRKPAPRKLPRPAARAQKKK